MGKNERGLMREGSSVPGSGARPQSVLDHCESACGCCSRHSCHLRQLCIKKRRLLEFGQGYSHASAVWRERRVEAAVSARINAAAEARGSPGFSLNLGLGIITYMPVCASAASDTGGSDKAWGDITALRTRFLRSRRRQTSAHFPTRQEKPRSSIASLHTLAVLV